MQVCEEQHLEKCARKIIKYGLKLLECLEELHTKEEEETKHEETTEYSRY